MRSEGSGTVTADAAGVPSLLGPADWEHIVREQQPRVYRLAYRLTGTASDAEDLTHDVFVRIFRSLHTYTEGNFDGWVTRITMNLFRDRWRRRKRLLIEPTETDELVASSASAPSSEEAWQAAHLDIDVRSPRTPLGALAAHVRWEHQVVASDERSAQAGQGLGACTLTGFLAEHDPALVRLHAAVHEAALAARGGAGHRESWERLAGAVTGA